MAFSMLAGTNALAGHQYRVAATAQARMVASNAHVGVPGQRLAQI